MRTPGSTLAKSAQSEWQPCEELYAQSEMARSRRSASLDAAVGARRCSSSRRGYDLTDPVRARATSARSSRSTSPRTRSSMLLERGSDDISPGDVADGDQRLPRRSSTSSSDRGSTDVDVGAAEARPDPGLELRLDIEPRLAMDAPPYSAAAGRRRPAAGRRDGARPRRRRGAARDPDRRPPRRGDDADAGPRRGARARLLPLRGPAPDERAAVRTTWPRTPSRSTRPASIPRACSGASTRRSSCGVCGKGALEAVAVEAPRVESSSRPGRAAGSSSSARAGCARRRRRSP